MKQVILILSLFILISCGNDNYEILNEKVSMNVSRIDVKLLEKVDKTELVHISKEIRSSREDYDKLWISFYLAEFLPESGARAWASGNYTPYLMVNINGEDKPIIGNQKVDFPMYETVMHMLEASNDYVGHNIEKLTDKPLHVRVSTEFMKGESKQNMIKQIKRDIIYVVFQTFAETNIENITVSSIPIVRESFNPNLPYDGKLLNNLKQTKTVTKKHALIILEKYTKTKSFKDLYQLNSTLYIPNDKFDLLKYGQLENVYNEL